MNRRFKLAESDFKNFMRHQIFKKIMILSENFVDNCGFNGIIRKESKNIDGTFDIQLYSEIYDELSCDIIWNYTFIEYIELICMCLKFYNFQFSSIEIINVEKKMEMIRWINKDKPSKYIEIEYCIKGFPISCKIY